MNGLNFILLKEEIAYREVEDFNKKPQERIRKKSLDFKVKEGSQ
ncbi:hypothetical protein LCGC14_1570850 [marine sediment metagenome]|uniref:Uncharacterized protein n=1 Tax=marine sediment metagenome TaxID=412755 RepID=A0A0F9LK42_9ZZZZ